MPKSALYLKAHILFTKMLGRKQGAQMRVQYNSSKDAEVDVQKKHDGKMFDRRKLNLSSEDAFIASILK